MSMKFLYLVLTVFLITPIIGCESNAVEENSTVTDNYENSRKVAWEFIKEKGWDDRAIKKLEKC